ncbi:hypothetical protein HPB49_016524 [Dermacentor silvarum]|uniref:Uncharacterized protein n=1 Tax=Dermacentor silvarum TaxID=543639 RepID=A0ACB8CGD5_DERSI|nr:hypothetical protein HPB49_016524 [Dermacentor silvarum]
MFNKGMDRLRRSLRDSLRRGARREHVPECSKPHQWQADEAAVRAGTCTFPVKYLGCVEVFESRGMQVCEEALKVLRNSRRRMVRGTLHVTGDGLRVVDETGTRACWSTRPSRRCPFARPTATTTGASHISAVTAPHAAGCAMDSWP